MSRKKEEIENYVKIRYERNMRMICLGFVVMLILFFVWLNYLYKHSVAYYNEFFDIKELVKNNDKKRKMIFLGSTYSKYAFGGYKQMKLDMADFSIQSQCLEMDYQILKRKADRYEPGTIVFIVLAACCMMYEGEKDRLIYHMILNDKKKVYSWKKNLEIIFPLLFHPKNIKRIFREDFCYESIYDAFPLNISKNQSEILLENLANGWKNMFGLTDLKSSILPEKSQKSINNNIQWMNKIVDFCIERKYVPVVVVPPFSDRLNVFYSRDFSQKAIDDNVELLIQNKKVLYFNYQWDDNFQREYSLFIDGGFRLNEKGSEIFLKRLFSDLNNYGFDIRNKKYLSMEKK